MEKYSWFKDKTEKEALETIIDDAVETKLGDPVGIEHSALEVETITGKLGASSSDALEEEAKKTVQRYADTKKALDILVKDSSFLATEDQKTEREKLENKLNTLITIGSASPDEQIQGFDISTQN